MTQFTRLSVKSLFIADAHLGVPDSPALALGHLLDRTSVSKGIYILGDLIDSRALSPEAALPPAHAEVLDRLQVSAASGVPVIYIPGDREGGGRLWLENQGVQDDNVGHHAKLDGLTLQKCGWYTDGHGHRHLLIHGDENEPDDAEPGLVRSVFSRLRAVIGGETCDIDGFVERKLVLAKEKHADGIICGHDGHQISRMHGRLFYRNPGSWAQHRTIMVETHSEQFVHIDWSEVLKQIKDHSLCEVFGHLADQLGLEVEKVEKSSCCRNMLGPIPDRPPSAGPANLLAALRYTG